MSRISVQPPGAGGGSGSGGGPATIADGADVAEGTTTDAAVVTDANGTLSGKLRGLVKMLADVWDSTNHRLKVDGSSVTQPVSASTLPLPTGAATAAKQPALGTAGAASADVITVQGIASGTAQSVSQGTDPWVVAQKTYSPTTGEFAPSTSATVFPTVAAKLVRLKARSANAGSVWVGTGSSMSAGDGTTDTTSGFQLAPGDDSGWLPVANLNVFYGKGDNASDSVTYMVLA